MYTSFFLGLVATARCVRCEPHSNSYVETNSMNPLQLMTSVVVAYFKDAFPENLLFTGHGTCM
jgi:hypothetical protein